MCHCRRPARPPVALRRARCRSARYDVPPNLHAVVAAGGEGRRFGGDAPKQFVEVAGRPVLEWSVDLLRCRAEIVVVALPAPFLERGRALFENREGVRCVAGGSSRWGSVSNALAALGAAETDLIAIHDAARPALTLEDLDAVVAVARRSRAAVLGRPVADTLKRLDGSVVVETVDRTALFRAETPQVFERRLLDRIGELARREDLDPTDESSLVERLEGVTVLSVPARHPNPKITHPGDLRHVDALLRDREVGRGGEVGRSAEGRRGAERQVERGGAG